MSKKQFLRNVNQLFPQIEAHNLVDHSARVRAQALNMEDKLIDDFYIVQAERACNAPSPEATASLGFGSHIIKLIDKQLEKYKTNNFRLNDERMIDK